MTTGMGLNSDQLGDELVIGIYSLHDYFLWILTEPHQEAYLKEGMEKTSSVQQRVHTTVNASSSSISNSRLVTSNQKKREKSLFRTPQRLALVMSEQSPIVQSIIFGLSSAFVPAFPASPIFRLSLATPLSTFSPPVRGPLHHRRHRPALLSYAFSPSPKFQSS